MLIDSRCGVSPFGNLQYLSPRVKMPVVDNITIELQKHTEKLPLVLINSNREEEIVRDTNLKVVDTFTIPGKNLMIIEFSR
jgi:hypothetical protein